MICLWNYYENPGRHRRKNYHEIIRRTNVVNPKLGLSLLELTLIDTFNLVNYVVTSMRLYLRLISVVGILLLSFIFTLRTLQKGRFITVTLIVR